MKYAEQAKEAAPDNVDVNGTLGWILYRKGLCKDAVLYLQQAVMKDGLSTVLNATIRKDHLAMV